MAVLYFENLSGAKEDEYFRDGITEDIITELSKIRGLNTFSRPTVLAFRDKPVTPAQIGQQLGAAYVLTGTLRRAGNRLRISAQLIDTHTDFPLWSERYDREMKDVFEVQDEIARKIAEACASPSRRRNSKRSPIKPTENLQAYDLYLRGKRYARRLTRQDLEFALQMFENAVDHRSQFRLAYAAIANVCAQISLQLQPRSGVGRARQGSLRQSRRSALGAARSARRPGLGRYTPTANTTQACAWSRRPSSASAIAKAPIIFFAARCLPPAATRKSPASPMPRSKPESKTTTSTFPS